MPAGPLPSQPAPPVDPRILAFYTDTYDEDQRLRARPSGRVELIRTRELLLRHLPTAPAAVLDVGGGTGIHARWLADAGYRVHLVDPVPAHVARASLVSGVEATLGDARHLEQSDSTVDATLLLGPLYHLTLEKERVLAVHEAARVTRAGGLVAAAAISRHAPILEQSAFGEVDEAEEARSAAVLASGVNDPQDGFTVAFFHTPAELVREMEAAGLVNVVVYGVEGPSIPALMTMPAEVAEQRVDSVVRAARMLERDPAMISSSPHLLAVGRVPA